MAHASQTPQEEVQDLWQQFKETASSSAREKLILHYAPLVAKVVGRMGLNPEGSIEWGDLINYGVLGLIDAIERFEPERGFTFQTFASLRIRGAVLDALRQIDPLGRQARRRVREAKDAIQRLTVTLGRVPTDEEVADEIDLTVEQYQQVLLDASFVLLSLDQPVREGGDEQKLQLSDLLEDPDAVDTLDQVEERELQARLGQAIQALPKREQILLSLYYYEDLTMREVAQVMEISQTRVCQLHARTLLTLKALIAPASAEKSNNPPPDDEAPEVCELVKPKTSSRDRDLSAITVDRRRSAYKARMRWAQAYEDPS
ncbi:MAG: FliA/WhiG family RNA polymerase sigma factor [Caldilineaceae bacterium]|nr:FliA/WhiG family RNA polymerase sigma factor [Caldilineaceae bacterium]